MKILLSHQFIIYLFLGSLSLSLNAEIPYCATLRQEVIQVNKHQEQLKNDHNQTMADLKKELDVQLAQLTFLEGINTIITDYKAKANKLQNQFDDNIGNIPKFITDAQELIIARQQVVLLNYMLNNDTHQPTSQKEWMVIKKRLNDYRSKHCECPAATAIINPKECEDFRIQPEFETNCHMITGFSASIKLLKKTAKNKDQLDGIINQAKHSIGATLECTPTSSRMEHSGETCFTKQQIENLESNISNYKDKINTCVQDKLTQSQAPSKQLIEQTNTQCISHVQTQLYAELAKHHTSLLSMLFAPQAYDKDKYFKQSEYNEELKKQKDYNLIKICRKNKKAIKQKLQHVFKLLAYNDAQAVQDTTNKFNFHKQLTELCPNIQYTSTECTRALNCLQSLTDEDLDKKIETIKTQMKKIDQQMIALKDSPDFKQYEQVKQIMLSELQSTCNVKMNTHAPCACQPKFITSSLDSFIKFGDQLMETYDVSKGGALYHLCGNLQIKAVAPFTCATKTANERSRRLARNYVTEYDKHGKLIKDSQQQRSSTGTIIFSAAAQTVVNNAIPTYLRMDNLKYQNKLLYQQAIAQADMNYLNEQQFNWYMQNYTLYGTDPYSLNGGYDPYYASTFQFGNPNFALYNGYYNY